MGINRISFGSPNSPDLHPFENFFDYFKDPADEFYPLDDVEYTEFALVPPIFRH
jgi:hypothetical protein